MKFKLRFVLTYGTSVVDLPIVSVGLGLIKKHCPSFLCLPYELSKLNDSITRLSIGILSVDLVLAEAKALNECFGLFENNSNMVIKVSSILNRFYTIELIKTVEKHELQYTLNRGKLLEAWRKDGAPIQWNNLE